MVDRKNGSQRIGVGSARRVPFSADSMGISGVVGVDVDRVIRSTCRDFARATDWQQVAQATSQDGDRSFRDPGTGYRLSEDHEGLHSGRFINVSVLQAANAVAIKGGYYDGYWQPRTVYREFIPLKEITPQSLSCLLMQMHDRLCSRDQPQVA
jgi:hypothetical protein